MHQVTELALTLCCLSASGNTPAAPPSGGELGGVANSSSIYKSKVPAAVKPSLVILIEKGAVFV